MKPKRFLIVKVYKSLDSSSILEQLDDKNDAIAMRDILRRKNDGDNYEVYGLED